VGVKRKVGPKRYLEKKKEVGGGAGRFLTITGKRTLFDIDGEAGKEGWRADEEEKKQGAM